MPWPCYTQNSHRIHKKFTHNAHQIHTKHTQITHRVQTENKPDTLSVQGEKQDQQFQAESTDECWGPGPGGALLWREITECGVTSWSGGCRRWAVQEHDWLAETDSLEVSTGLVLVL